MRRLVAALVLVAAFAGAAVAQTTVSGPVTFGTGLSVANTGAVSIATSQSGLTCSGCTLSGATLFPNNTKVDNGGDVGVWTSPISGAALTIGGSLASIANQAGAWPTYDPSATSFAVTDNMQTGRAEVDIVNTSNLAGGFQFYQMTGAGAGNLLVDIAGATGRVNAAGGFAAAGTAGVSCAAGTVSLTTFTVTDGIVTHC